MLARAVTSIDSSTSGLPSYLPCFDGRIRNGNRFDVNRIALEVLLLDQVIDGSRFSSLFLAVRLVVLPHCVTRQESFVLLCQLAQGGEQLPRLELEARQLPQTRKDKFGWPFHDPVYGRFLMPRCDVKHTTTQPVRSVRVTTQRELAGALDRAVSEASAALLA